MLLAATKAAVLPFRSPDPHTSQIKWSQRSIKDRLGILKRARHDLATSAPRVAESISPQLSRTAADTMVTELLPLLDAIRFLEREAPRLLRTRSLGSRGLPFWLSGIRAEVRRVPFGRVLVIGPSNYPLFLPGVQVFQALAAGNAVTWKPGSGGAPVAHLIREALVRAGLPGDLLQVTEDTVTAARNAVAAGGDKVFFTGSASAGKLLLHQLADTATPCVAELSGNDATIVLPSADLDRVVSALAFGMRLNGSATCMAPRRVLLVDCTPSRRRLFLDRLTAALARVSPVAPSPLVCSQLARLVEEAEQGGATVLGKSASGTMGPILLVDCRPEMQIAQADIFAPVLAVIDVQGNDGAIAAQAACPLALTTSIFGEEKRARELAGQISCGTVTINDLIVPTADPRVPFGGRRQSGFGVTRGAEGLLEMTAIQVISTRHSRSSRQYEPTGLLHAELFDSIITAAHSGRLRQRWSALRRALTAAMGFQKK
ncbi:MAG: aldehyde dehydrogenase family protein [Acidobacteriaceae bacterium]